MTTEIAVLNKIAVALAADSAVTIGNRKVYNTVNKLFTLSKYHPVGIMVYGNAEFMEIPWETLIKTYRQQLRASSFRNLASYASHFLEWLEKNRQLFPGGIQDRFARHVANGTVSLVRDRLLKLSEAHFKTHNEVDANTIGQLLEQAIAVQLGAIQARPYLPSLGPAFAKEITTRYEEVIAQAQVDGLERVPLSEAARIQLAELFGEIVARGLPSQNRSGIVIAGFGADDLFPAVEAFDIEGIVCDRLVYRRDKDACAAIDHDLQALVLPFAQTDEARAFVEGVSPTVMDAFTSYITVFGREYPKAILADINKVLGQRKLSPEQDQKLQEAFAKLAHDEAAAFRRRFHRFQSDQIIDPLMGVVSSLPKDELGVFAESLVNLTSIKRKFSMGPESVGGPVDVAVISKGDGFVWIRRKMYFEDRLNPQFKANYFKFSPVEEAGDDALAKPPGQADRALDGGTAEAVPAPPDGGGTPQKGKPR